MSEELSTAELRALETAREVWPTAVPNDADIEAAVRRLRPRVRRTKRRLLPRQLGRLSVIFVVLGFGLAWAAGGKSQLVGYVHPPAPAKLQGELGAGVHAMARSVAKARPGTVRPNPQANSGETAKHPEASKDPALAQVAAPALGRRVAGKAATRGRADAIPTDPAPAWGKVREALAVGNAQDAERALAELTTHTEPETQLKAQLGLAQLALSRGDCKRASAISAQILSKQGAGLIQKRALDIAARCHGQ